MEQLEEHVIGAIISRVMGIFNEIDPLPDLRTLIQVVSTWRGDMRVRKGGLARYCVLWAQSVRYRDDTHRLQQSMSALAVKDDFGDGGGRDDKFCWIPQ